jgi:hypothetical protein
MYVERVVATLSRRGVPFASLRTRRVAARESVPIHRERVELVCDVRNECNQTKHVRGEPAVRAIDAQPTDARATALDETRKNVRALLTESAAFQALPPEKQREIARNTVEIASYLAAPEGIPGNKLAPTSRAQDAPAQTGEPEPGKFVAQGAREGAAVAGALLREVNFPEFVSGLINGVFHSIVQSSIEQMEAYGRLVADVAKTLNQFRDENVSVNQGRDHLVDSFPDLFQIDIDSGSDFFGESGGPRVRLRDGVDESQALGRVRSSLPVEGEPLTSLDDEAVESRLVPAARTQLATSRQQLLATMVMLGINRIVVTDGKISAKVMYDFQARDNFKSQTSATRFDYDQRLQKVTQTGNNETQYDGGGNTYNLNDGSSTSRGASYYTKGDYKYTSEPVLKLASVTQEATDTVLQTRANLAGTVEVNFKSDYLPLDKIADNMQIGMIQNAAKPGNRAQAATGTTSSGTATPASGTTPPAQNAPTA